MHVHRGEEPYKCKLCSQTFKFKSSRAKHLNKHLGIKKPKAQCSVCGKLLSCTKSLKDHMVMQTGETPFQCDICSEQFAYRFTYKLHVMRQRGEEPHQCHVCGKTVMLAAGLNFHMWIHINDRPHKCHICQKGFISSSSLRKLMRSHPDESRKTS